jgi:hypothetical protein
MGRGEAVLRSSEAGRVDHTITGNTCQDLHLSQ